MRYVEGSKKVFLDTGTRFPRKVIWAVALIKREAALANASLGLLDPRMASAIARASKETMDGRHDSKVVVDVFQTGSGTGLNMNLNELIAERAEQLLPTRGAKKKKKATVHPNDHVNMSQSSNDVAPSAIRVAAVAVVREELEPAFATACASLVSLSKRTAGVYKAGRTHLRDALPVTMGQEFSAYADALDRDLKLVLGAISFTKELPLGGTAVGTGVNADPRFGPAVVRGLARSTGLGFSQAKSRFRAMRLLTDMVALSSMLGVAALDVYRLCQDIRLMFSGPLTGLGEIEIPTQEEIAGSSIMPGKTNPVTAEAAMLASAQVVGLDRANQVAGMLGEFEMSMGVPLVGLNVTTQASLLAEALRKLSSVVLDGVVPDVKRSRAYAEASPALVTAISPALGYDRASTIGKKVARGLPIRDGLRQLGYTDIEIERILDLRKLVGNVEGG